MMAMLTRLLQAEQMDLPSIDVCNVISVPQQNLVDYYSNQVYGNVPGSV